MSDSPKPFKLYPSTNPLKKYDVYVPIGKKLKRVSYGQNGASDYTTHDDLERRDRYRARHAKDRIHDPTTPGFWSWWHLWGETSDPRRAFAQAVALAKKILK